jgi:glucan phosphoethanolaminetransferase (alkaline phosphatase superfamily)
MLQRIQTIYLFIAVLISGVLIFFVSLWRDEVGDPVYVEEMILALALFLGSAFISLITIFLYKNRKLQFVLGRANILLNFILLGVFVYWTLTVPGEMQISEKGIGMFLPVLSIVFLVLANKAIKKDEDLVKSVDRLR